VLNGTFGMSSKNIDISACTITFSVKANGHEYTANIPAGLYSQTDFVTIISEYLNTSYYDETVKNDIDDALAFKISLSSDNKLSVNFAKSSLTNVGGITKWSNAKNMDEAIQVDSGGNGTPCFKSTGGNGAAPAGQMDAYAVSDFGCLSHGWNTLCAKVWINDGSTLDTNGSVQQIVGLMK
jgi:hypothetical protein